MSKKGKIILAVTISTAVLASSAAAATIIVCKKIFEKRYISAN